MSLSRGEESRSFPDGQPLAHQPKWCQDFPTDIPEDDEVGRREFIKFLVLTSGAFVAGQCWIGVMSLFDRTGSWPKVRIAGVEELKEKKVVEFRYPGDDDPCLLLLLNDGRRVAYGQKCTHLSCAVVPDLDANRLHCPCHHGYFEVEHGRPTAGPPRRPLPLISLIEEGDAIFATGVELRTV